MARTSSDKPYHVVHIKWKGEHAGYDIYKNNKPFLQSRHGYDHPNRLKKWQAYMLVTFLNAGYKKFRS